MADTDEIASELRKHGSVCLSVRGKSMLPTIWPSDWIRIETVDVSSLTEGDVVLFRSQDRCFVHRVQQVVIGETGERTFLTQGDAMPEADPHISGEQILGRVAGGMSSERKFELERRRSIWNRSAGTVLANVGPISSLASRLIDEKLAWKKKRKIL